MTELTDITAWKAKDIAALRYEQARDALDVVVTALEDSDVALEDLMKLWEIGNAITKVCEAHLAVAAEKLNDGLPSAD